VSTILITGARGFIGGALARAMSAKHAVVCLSRGDADVDGTACVRGDFTRPEDLHGLDPHHFDAVLHLAGANALDGEAACLAVNVQGTYGLLRHLIVGDCRKFVLASSIAATGMQSTRFRPLSVPIDDEHPCLDRHGYGFSKFMMEQLIRYLSRQDDSLDFICIRLGVIIPDGDRRQPTRPGPVPEWTVGHLSFMYLSDAVECFRLATQAAPKPGARIMNAVGADVCVEPGVGEVLRSWYPDATGKLDLKYYERPDRRRASVFDIRRVEQEIGFVPKRSLVD